MFRTLRTARRPARLAAILIGAVLAASAQAGDHGPRTTLQAQRAAFRSAWASASQQGGEAWRKLAAGLHAYPLYPYLPAAAMEHDIDSVPRARVQAYLKRYPHWIPAQRLRSAYLRAAGQRGDWSDFRALYRPGLGDTLSCYHLQARLAAGATLRFHRDLAALWRQPSLPDACDPVLTWAHTHGMLGRKRLWQRIDVAARAGHTSTVAALARWLRGNDADAAARLLQALRDPARAAAAARHWPDTPRSRAAAALALRRLSRRDSTRARKLWPALQRHLRFDRQQALSVRTDIALFSATDFAPHAGRLLARLPRAAQDPSTREWRVRVALARRDWHAVLQAIAALPHRQREQEEWRYFRARALAALGHRQAAAQAYAGLADQADYFGFLAADRIGAPYAICPRTLDDPAPDANALLANPGLRRAFELYAVNLLPQARREWARALAGASAAKRRSAAVLAFQRGWYDRAVFTFSSGHGLKLYRLRFPLARQDGMRGAARDAGIDPAWAYAVARAESAWVADARSGAGALGLMQLMPKTARKVARHYGLDYAGAGSLTDPHTNITLGTRYLADMAQRYGGAPWLASAAYNAGPAKLDAWLAARGALPPDVFVATMPYHETRDYVARVMAFSVIYDWRLNGRVVALDRRMPRFGKAYAPPGPQTPRKPVVCPTEAGAGNATGSATAGAR